MIFQLVVEFPKTDLEGLRPGTGIPINELDYFIGKKVNKDKKGNLLKRSDIIEDDI